MGLSSQADMLPTMTHGKAMPFITHRRLSPDRIPQVDRVREIAMGRILVFFFWSFGKRMEERTKPRSSGVIGFGRLDGRDQYIVLSFQARMKGTATGSMLCLRTR